MGNIKSPTRNAGNALQRMGFMSPGSRFRGGSINELGMGMGGVASEETSLGGRMGVGVMSGGVNFR